MKDLSGMQLVVAATGEDGLAHFIDTPPPRRFAMRWSDARKLLKGARLRPIVPGDRRD